MMLNGGDVELNAVVRENQMLLVMRNGDDDFELNDDNNDAAAVADLY